MAVATGPHDHAPHDLVYERTADGIPYVVPEIVLLFKARDVRPKDQADFDRVAPILRTNRRDRLAGWLTRVTPDHAWLGALRAG